jgi:hypothetical protein
MSVAFVRRKECVPNDLGFSPMLETQFGNEPRILPSRHVPTLIAATSE